MVLVPFKHTCPILSTRFQWTGIDFPYFGLDSGMVFEETTVVYECICCFNSKWIRKSNMEIRNGFYEAFLFKLKWKNDDLIFIYIRFKNESGFGELGGTSSPKSPRNTLQPPGLKPGGTPLYKLCRYVPPHRVGFLHLFGLKMSIAFASFGLESGMVFEGTTGVNEHINRLNSKWRGKKEKYANSKLIWRIFLFAL